jgi:NhaP-type Na+/H+ or K+/H+ antiporter
VNHLNSTEINTAFAALGGLIVLLGLFSGFLKERLFLSDPFIALVAGILLSPAVFNWVNLSHWGSTKGILEQGARLAIAVQVVAIALRLPKGYVYQSRRSLMVLLGLVMPLMWLASGLLATWLLEVSIWQGMLIGAIVTPTDPVIGSAVVTGRIAENHLPGRIRNLISLESAANDGLAYPFVWLSILMLTRPTGEAMSHWIFKTILWEVVGAAIAGTVLGYGLGKLLLWVEQKQTQEKQSFLALTIAFSLLILGSIKLLGGDGIFGVFVAGIVFDNTVEGTERAEETEVQDAIDRFFTILIFALLGLVLPWQEWIALGWRGVGLAIAILLFRRLPAILLVQPLMPRLQSIKDALFVGWFGPIGVAALFYSILALKQTDFDLAWTVGSLVICSSVIVHGFTSTPSTKLYDANNRE